MFVYITHVYGLIPGHWAAVKLLFQCNYLFPLADPDYVDHGVSYITTDVQCHNK